MEIMWDNQDSANPALMRLSPAFGWVALYQAQPHMVKRSLKSSLQNMQEQNNNNNKNLLITNDLILSPGNWILINLEHVRNIKLEREVWNVEVW